MRRFYTPNITGEKITVNNEEAKHILRVLRMKAGDMLILFDGSGFDYVCSIVNEDISNLELIVMHKQEGNTQELNITLYQALIKSDTADSVVQKSTECGVSKIVFFSAERSIKKLDEKGIEKFLIRQQKIATQSAKQSKRATIPKIEYANKEDMLKISHEIILLAYEDEKKTTIKDALHNRVFKDVGVIIGTEGGLSPKEAEKFISLGATSVTLGNNILRAQTAGIVAISMINYERMD